MSVFFCVAAHSIAHSSCDGITTSGKSNSVHSVANQKTEIFLCDDCFYYQQWRHNSRLNVEVAAAGSASPRIPLLLHQCNKWCMKFRFLAERTAKAYVVTATD